MKKDITSYNGLEKHLDGLLPSWIVPVGRVLRELELDNKVNENLRWGFRVKFKGKTVSKATPVNIDGNLVWREIDTKFAIPDFVVLDKSQMKTYEDMVDVVKKGKMAVNPFKHLMCDSGWYVEILGNYYHSNEYVRGLSRQEHEREIIEAYESASAHVLILWEDEVKENWAEVGLPKLVNYIDKAGSILDLPPMDVKCPIGTDEDSVEAWRSLFSPSYFRSLDIKRRDEVLSRIFKMMRGLEYPWVDVGIADYDFHRFIDWCSGSRRKGTRFGADFCFYFTKSMADARVAGKRSSKELWNDDKLLNKCIKWQLENEDGIHHARRFLHAMRHESGFRVVSNLHPSFVCKLIDNHFGDIRGKTVLDPCAGWGGRLLAVFGLGGNYIGIDANEKLVGELNEMSRYLRYPAIIKHGDSSVDVTSIVSGQVDFVLTSPPYFGFEDYSNDKEQSSRYVNLSNWISNFLVPMVSSCLSVLRNNGKMLFIVNRDFNSEYFLGLGCAILFDELVTIERKGKKVKERVIVLQKGKEEEDTKVRCNLCGRLFDKIGLHISKEHGMSPDEYYSLFAESSKVSPDMLHKIKKANLNKTGLIYTKRIAYKLPDGSIVRRSNVWKKAWGTDNPPLDTILDASEVNLDKWVGQVEGVDYVVCLICGHKGNDLTRHLKDKHGITQGYEGSIRSTKCEKSLKLGAVKTWNKRVRKPIKDKSLNKTHKVNGLTEELLKKLVEEGLSNIKIGLMFGMTGEGVAYRRKKYRI